MIRGILELSARVPINKKQVGALVVCLPMCRLDCSHGHLRPTLDLLLSSVTWSFPSRQEQNRTTRQRIPNQETKTQSTIRNLTAAVSNFERWLWEQPFGDRRMIEQIPPSELDLYLVKFYAVVQKPTGGEYDPDSLSSVRSYLERYLKEHNYPASLTRSPEFFLSQQAFKARRQQLARLQTARRIASRFEET